MSDQKYKPKWRDWIAYWLATAALKLGTPEYREFITAVYELGMEVIQNNNRRSFHGLR